MIYFLRDELTKFIKIGFTDRPLDERIRELQTGCAGNLVAIFSMEGTEADEKAWKQRFAKCRSRRGGEWFRPVPKLLLAIYELKIQKLEEENEAFYETSQAMHFEKLDAESAHSELLRSHSRTVEQLHEALQEIQRLTPPRPRSSS
jgi:hypothetical protein